MHLVLVGKKGITQESWEAFYMRCEDQINMN